MPNPLSLGIFGQLAAVRDRQDARAQTAAQAQASLEDRLAARDFQKKQGARLDAETFALRNPAPKAADEELTWDDDGQGHRTAYMVNKTKGTMRPVVAEGTSYAVPTGSSSTRTLEDALEHGGQDQGQSAPPTIEQRVAAPARPKGLTQTKAAPAIVYTPRSFMEDGKEHEGFSDPQGNFYHADKSKATGQITPYRPPKETKLVAVKHPDGTTTMEPETAHMVSDEGGRKTAMNQLSAPLAARVGQAGEMMKKYYDLIDATKSLDVSLGSSAARDVAEHGVHVPLLGTLPGSKGIGNIMMNRSPEYATYQAAIAPFRLAAAHAMSGAKIGEMQREEINRGIEMGPGDFANPTVRKQKEKNMIDLLNSIAGSLPKDAIAEQEDQMDPGALEALVAHGYRRVARTPKKPSLGGKTVVVNGKTFVIP